MHIGAVGDKNLYLFNIICSSVAFYKKFSDKRTNVSERLFLYWFLSESSRALSSFGENIRFSSNSLKLFLIKRLGSGD